MNNWYLIYGPMKAGKTTRLQTFARMCQQKYIIINHKKDVRFGVGMIVSHDRREMPSFSCDSPQEFDLFVKVETPDSIFLDEVQFHTVEFIDHLIRNHSDKKIYFSGLDLDFNGRHFMAVEKLLNLVPLDNQVHLKAICGCGNFATYSKLCGEPPLRGNILVGDNYAPVCRKCFHSL
jgi:thymidine kinase